MRKIFNASFFVVLLFCPLLLSAEETQSGEQCEYEMLSAGPFTTWTAPVCCKGQFVVQPYLIYNKTRGFYDASGDYNSFAGGDRKNQLQESLYAMLGVTDRLELSGQIYYQENYVKYAGESASANGFGDSYLYLRYCMVDEKEGLPHITGLLQMKFPTGKYEDLSEDKLGADLMGTGSYDPAVGLIMTKTLKPFKLHADLIYNVPLETKIDGFNIRYGQYLNYDVGVEYFLPKGFNLLFELNGLVQGNTDEDGERIDGSDYKYLVGGLGVGWSNETIQTLLAYQRTLLGTNADANDSVMLTFVYSF